MIQIYRNKAIHIDQLLALYQSVGWTNYTKQPDMLDQAYKHSLLSLAAYDEGDLVGLIRVVGDGYSIIFVQDILVNPDYQRRGIGRLLLETVLEEFKHVYQIHLATDQTAKTMAFYESLGFKSMEDIGARAYTYIR